jgi:hypothetical protein
MGGAAKQSQGSTTKGVVEQKAMTGSDEESAACGTRGVRAKGKVLLRAAQNTAACAPISLPRRP